MTCTAARHGTTSAYQWWGCRCPDARERNRVYRKRLRENRHTPALVPALGTIRRLRALVAAGYPQSDLGARLGVSLQRVRQHVAGEAAMVHRATAEKVAALFAELAAVPGPSKYARTVASKNGWLPPLAWDDLDDPGSEPDPGTPDVEAHVDEVAVERALAGDLVALTDAELVAAVHVGVARGLSHERLAALLRIDFRAVRTVAGGVLPPRFSSVVRHRLELVRAAA